MNKSVLILDAPKDCGHCLLSDFVDGDNCMCRKAERKNNATEKPKWCPLRTPLKEVDKDYYIYRTDYLFENLDREIELLESHRRFLEHMKNRGETEC